MKRRGFLGMLFGAPAAVVAGKAMAELPQSTPALFPPAPVESEPDPELGQPYIGTDYETCFSVSTEPYRFK
jgi:hypothetical protein